MISQWLPGLPALTVAGPTFEDPRGQANVPVAVATIRQQASPATKAAKSAPPMPQRQVQRFWGGTPARAWSTCWPQPVQVILLQRLQTAGLHIGTLLSGWGCGDNTPWGISVPLGDAGGRQITARPG